jgi:hypothetical protein
MTRMNWASSAMMTVCCMLASAGAERVGDRRRE